MKGVYVLTGSVTERDLDVVSLAGQKFDYVTVAFKLFSGECGINYADSVAKTIIGIKERGILGVSIDFFVDGGLEEFLQKKKADFLIVPVGLSEQSAENINFSKYVIN